jgi:hypothetical protein
VTVREDPPPGLRVVLDARPLQDPARAPATARYLEGLLGAYDATPLPGESFAFLLQADLDDPTAGLTGLDVVGRRLLPPTRLLRSGALTIDPFLLRWAPPGAPIGRERPAPSTTRPPGRRRSSRGFPSSSRCWISLRGSCRRHSSERRRRDSGSDSGRG